MVEDVGQRRRGRVLVSDDDEFFRVAIRAVLQERNGFSDVIETSSFEMAIDRLGTSGPVEMGLFDLNMLGMENWLDLAAVRGEYPDMRLVVVSASRCRFDILKALEIGAHGFIHKGLGVSELSRAIDSICDGHVYVPPFLPDIGISSSPAGATSAAEMKNVVQTADAVLVTSDAELITPNRSGLRQCSPRQRQIIDLLIAGHSNKGMARTLNLSEGTIKFHMSAVMRLLGANSRVEAATRAMKQL